MRLRSDSTARARRLRSRKHSRAAARCAARSARASAGRPSRNLRLRDGSGFEQENPPVGRPAGLDRDGHNESRSDFLVASPRAARARSGSAAPVRRSQPNPSPVSTVSKSQHIETSRESSKKASERAQRKRLRAARLRLAGPYLPDEQALEFVVANREAGLLAVETRRQVSPSAWRIDSVKPRSNCRSRW